MQRDALEFAMRLESNSGLAKASIPGMSPGMAQVQYRLMALSEQIQELAKAKPSRREAVWCTMCKTEGNLRNDFP
jgi:hypothetical protein